MNEKPGDEGSEPTALTTDEGGNIYITGFVHIDKTVNHDVDYVTLKYDANGTQVWQDRYNGLANDCDRAHAIAVDEAGNAYVTGESYNGDWEKGDTDYDVVTIKYDVRGHRSSTWPDVGYGQGIRRYDGAHRADWDKKIALDGSGNVYVGVTSSRLTAGGARCSDLTVLKYDVHGNPSSTWPDLGNGVGVRRYNYSGDGQDDLNGMAVDISSLRDRRKANRIAASPR